MRIKYTACKIKIMTCCIVLLLFKKETEESQSLQYHHYRLHNPVLASLMWTVE